MKKRTMTLMKRSGLASQRVKVAAKKQSRERWREAHVACEVVTRKAVEASYDEKSEDLFRKHDLGAIERRGGKNESDGGDERGPSVEWGQRSVKQQW
tara:strand:- start:126 stop:416 length:291 start_codon:yes stop_codon:yes gene_type:complete